MALADSALVALGTPSRLLEMALVYWTRSANQGDLDARVKMGDYYFTGIGAEADVTKAHACYKVAAEDRSAMAMWNLGWMHENGVGVPKVKPIITVIPCAYQICTSIQHTHPPSLLLLRISIWPSTGMIAHWRRIQKPLFQ